MINRELVKMNAYLPVKLADLSTKNPDAALELLRDWGEGRKPLVQLLEETHEHLAQ